MKIKCNVQILSKKTIDEMPFAWARKDYLYLLEYLGYEYDSEGAEVKDVVMMALADLEPIIAADILLKYRLKKYLTKSQIKQLSYYMQENKVAEEYPDIFIQQELFNINQLLFKSFGGRFPNCKAIELVMTLEVDPTSYMLDQHWINEIIIKALTPALGKHSSIARLYQENMNGEKRFPDASGILWKTEVSKFRAGGFAIQLYSSEYWLHNLCVAPAYNTTIKVLELQEMSNAL